MDPAPVSQIQFVKPSHKRGTSEDVNDHPVTKTQNIVLIDPEDWYRSFYLVVPNASLFTIVPPPEESSAPTTSVANFVTPQSVVESNPPTAGPELVEETTENLTEDVIEDVKDVVEDEDVTEEITEYNNVDLTEPPLIMDATFEESPIQEVSSDCMLPAPLTHLYDDKYKAYLQKELLEKAEQLFYQISITDEEAAAVEERTRQQRVSPDWHEQRHGRITSSAFHDVWVRKDTTNPDRLVQQILYDSNDLSVIPAVQWGIENESRAQQQ